MNDWYQVDLDLRFDEIQFETGLKLQATLSFIKVSKAEAKGFLLVKLEKIKLSG